jgi:hypothetical protein
VPGIELFGAAPRALVEVVVRADDAAVRRCGIDAVLGALLALSSRPAPTATLGASGPSAAARAERLLDAGNGRSGSVAAIGGAVAALATWPGVPVLIVAYPASPSYSAAVHSDQRTLAPRSPSQNAYCCRAACFGGHPKGRLSIHRAERRLRRRRHRG